MALGFLPLPLSAGAGPVVADLSQTLGAVTLAAAGTLPIVADVAQTLGAVTLAATGAITRVATLAQTLGAVTLAADGSAGIFGVLAQTLGGVALAATGGAAVGQLAITLGPVAIVATGQETRAGVLSATLGGVTLSAIARLPIAGRVAKTLGAVTLAASGTLPIVGSLGATLGPLTLAATDSPKTFFFGWTDADVPFSSAMVREDEQIFALEISQEEGEFPSLRIDVVNPRVGLLAAGRNLWCWLSWRNGGAIRPLFNGRLIGIPENLHDEVVRLIFVARPNDYQTRKATLAELLKVRPYWDPVWIADGEDDPDTVLEARTQSWHIDRTTLVVSVSDGLVGEDGTVVVTADDHFYDGMEVTYGDTPLRRVSVNATVTWTQAGTGTVDLTQKMVDAFRAAGSPFQYPLISSLTGDGLFTSWPKPDTNIGAGWKIGLLASIEAAPWAGAPLLLKSYLRPSFQNVDVVERPGTWGGAEGPGGITWHPPVTRSVEVFDKWQQWSVIFPLNAYAINFPVTWTAARPRIENISFVLDADVQELLVNPGDAEEHKISLSSAFVAEPLDPGGLLPIADLRRNTYLNTGRGAQSIEYLVMLARAKLRARARAVNIKIEVPWHIAVGLSCRHNLQVLDGRLPGGSATGKVTSYSLTASGEGEMQAGVSIGCSVGHGGTISPLDGAPTYADDYVEGYQVGIGGIIDPGSGDVTYESIEEFDAVDDDGVDLFQMTPDRVVNSIAIEGSPNHQIYTTLAGFPEYNEEPILGYGWSWNNDYAEQDDPSTVLKRDPTIVTLDLVPIGGQAFETNYALTVSPLVIPQTVNTEAP